MVVALVVVIADQLSKWAIIEWVPLYDKVPINSFINLTHQRNLGAAFSFLANAGGWQRWFFVVLSTGVSAFIVVWIWRIRGEGQTLLAAGLALVLGGAVGNLIDRLMYGHVTTGHTKNTAFQSNPSWVDLNEMMTQEMKKLPSQSQIRL